MTETTESSVNEKGTASEKVLNKIKRLLALGDKTKNGSDQEAQASMLKAQELMAQYGVEMKELDAEEVNTYKTGVATTKWNMGFRKPLARVIADNFRCEIYIMGNQSVAFFGHPTDVAIAVETFEFAYKYANTGANRAYSICYKNNEPTRGVYNTYCQGFIDGLKQKLEEQSTALMIITPKDVVDEYAELSKDFKTTACGIATRGNNHAAYGKGFHDGKTAMTGKALTN